MRRTWLVLAAGLALVLAGGGSATASVTAVAGKAASAVERLPAGDGPPGFWWGTDSAMVSVPGRRRTACRSSVAPTAATSGCPGTGRTGWAAAARTLPRLLGDQQCAGAHQLPDLPQGRRQRRVLVHGRARRRPALERDGREAYAWGAQQAARALIDIANGASSLPGRLDGHRDSGHWARAPTTAGTRCTPRACSGKVKQQHILAASTGPTSTGSAATSRRTPLPTGVYSAPSVWASIFGTGTASGCIPNTDEWTYEPETTNLGNAPIGFCLKSGACAQFFGGVTRHVRQRPDVAVVRRRRGAQRHGGFRRPRPDRRRPAGLITRRSAARARCPGARAGPGRAATCR